MEVQAQLDRLTGIVDALASSVVAHDDQIENLILVAEKHSAKSASQDDRIGNLITVAELHREELNELRHHMSDLGRSMSETDRLFQAYLKRLPPQ